MRIRQRPQQNAFDHREDRGICANPQSEGQDSQHSHSWCLPQLAQPVVQIVEKSRHGHLRRTSLKKGWHFLSQRKTRNISTVIKQFCRFAGMECAVWMTKSGVSCPITNRAKTAASRYFYSYRSASMGCIRAAFRAGKNPDTIPTIDRIVNEIIITPIDACRKIAPSWSVVL